MIKKIENRQQEIYQKILTNGKVRVVDLAKEYDVSMETIRKDLNRMESQGLLHKTHGGACRKEDNSEVAVNVKVNENASFKQNLAKRALGEIPDHSSLFIGPGSTTLSLAKLLPLKKDLLVVTNSLMIANEVTNQKHELIFLGGKVLKKSQCATGAFTLNYIDAIHFDVACLGCDGFKNSRGPTTFSFEEMEVNQHVLRQAEKKIILADQSKFNWQGTYMYAPFDSFDLLITNPIDVEKKKRIQGCNLIIAK